MGKKRKVKVKSKELPRNDVGTTVRIRFGDISKDAYPCRYCGEVCKTHEERETHEADCKGKNLSSS